MADEQQEVQEKKAEVISIREAVAGRIAGSSGTVRNAVIDAMADVEVCRRASILRKAVEKFDELRRELNKIKPDIVAFDENGAKTSENWSKEQVEKKKKQGEQMMNLSKLIDKALADDATKDDWKKLEEKC